MANLVALAQVQKLDLSGLNVDMPISESHFVMAYAYALGALGIHIGTADDHVSPDEAMRALVEGLRETAAMARKNIADQHHMTGGSTPD